MEVPGWRNLEGSCPSAACYRYHVLASTNFKPLYLSHEGENSWPLGSCHMQVYVPV